MKIKSIRVMHFKRFTDLKVQNLSETARMVVLIGPNGSGKTSLFEALNFWWRLRSVGQGYDLRYHLKNELNSPPFVSYEESLKNVEVEIDTPYENQNLKDKFYFRTAYRHQADFQSSGIQKMGDPKEDRGRPERLINTEERMADNFQRLVGAAVGELFTGSDPTKTIGEVTERLIGKIRKSMLNVFGDLTLQGVGNPTQDGTFLFEKGTSKDFEFINLSGGEKAAFDLLLDLTVKTETFDDTIYFIDEPELHMNSRLQAALLYEMFAIVPKKCQLWIATHSIGMMRKAMEIYKHHPEQVLFLDFENHNFDQPVVLEPKIPGRELWKRVFSVALDDLGELVAPEVVIFCEGKPHHEEKTNKTTFDAHIYNQIFDQHYPTVTFVPLGGTNDLEKNALLIGGVFDKLFAGITIGRLSDRDDHADKDISDANSKGYSVLSERDLESYLWSDEILEKLCQKVGHPEFVDEILLQKQTLLSDLKGRPIDDVKAVSGQLYNVVKKKLELTQCGNNAEAFAKVTLVPLITPETNTYRKLEKDIFAPVKQLATNE